MKVQFIHGLEGSPHGKKATYLAGRFELLAPSMDTRNFEAAVRTQAAELEGFAPDVLVGSSFGGAVAVALLDRGVWRGPTVLLAPAHRYFFGVERLPDGVAVIIAHGRRDDVISFADSERLAATGSREFVELVEVDDGHRLDSLVDGEALADLVRRVAMLGR